MIMSVNITGPALSSLLFEHCNADGDRVCICCSLSSISRIQRPLKACFRLLHDDDYCTVDVSLTD